MGDYSFLADLLNKFHTSKPLIQFVLAVVIPLFLLGLGWYLKEICIAFANKGQPKGDLLYAISRNNKGKLVFYCNNITQEEMKSYNVMIPMAEEPKQIEEKTDDNGGANEPLADDDMNEKGGGKN